MKPGSRKFTLAVLGLMSFTLIMMSGSIDPFNLGLGIGMLITPVAVSNAFEHKFKK